MNEASDRGSSKSGSWNGVYLSGYAARPRRDWGGEALSVLAATAVGSATAYTVWERWSSIIEKRTDAWVSNSSTLSMGIVRTAQHPGFRLALILPLVGCVSTAAAGGARGTVRSLWTGTTTFGTQEKWRVRHEFPLALGFVGGVGLAAAVYMPMLEAVAREPSERWRPTMVDRMRAYPSKRFKAVVLSISLGLAGGSMLVALFKAQVWLFQSASDTASSWVTRLCRQRRCES